MHVIFLYDGELVITALWLSEVPLCRRQLKRWFCGTVTMMCRLVIVWLNSLPG
jgi:hypothetical protein